MKKIFLIPLVCIVIILIVLASFIFFKEKSSESSKTLIPSLKTDSNSLDKINISRSDAQPSIQYSQTKADSAGSGNSGTISGSVSPNSILGTWTAISEEVGVDSELNRDIHNYSITFNNDSTYSSITWGVEKSGKYKLDGDYILFYDSEDDLNKTGSFVDGYVTTEGNKLILTLPIYPKVVVYQK